MNLSVKKINHKHILVLLAILSFTACKKNKTEESSPTPVVIQKIKIYNIDGDTVNYTYDTQGRLLTRVSTTSNWKSEFTYSCSTFTENYYVGTNF